MTGWSTGFHVRLKTMCSSSVCLSTLKTCRRVASWRSDLTDRLLKQDQQSNMYECPGNVSWINRTARYSELCICNYVTRLSVLPAAATTCWWRHVAHCWYFSIRHVPKLGYRVGEMSCSRCTDVVDALRRRPSTRSLRPLSAKSHRHLPRRPHPVGRSSSDGTRPNDINSISRRYASRESPSLLTVPRRTSPDLASRCCSALS